MDQSVPSLQINGASKSFGATLALSEVDFDVDSGEIHALVGENGAGKSTLIKLLSGVHEADAGTIRVDGKPVAITSPADALAAGIATIPQEVRLVPTLSVAENIVLGRWPRKWGGLAIDRKQMAQTAADVLGQVGVSIPPWTTVSRLDFAERQLILIAKALRLKPRILILDEPTAALERREVERLLHVLDRLRAEGTAIIYVSHKLHEVVEMADRCTVLRDGRVVHVGQRGSLQISGIVRHMTGRDLHQMGIRETAIGPRALKTDLVEVHVGEIAALGGLLGSGARRHVHGLFGAGDSVAAEMSDGRITNFKHPSHAMKAGFGLVPGERSLGLVMHLSVRDNIMLPNLPRGARAALVHRKFGDLIVRQLIDQLNIRPSDPDLPVSALSGGNQQKTIFAKWLARKVEILLLDEPTHGIDIAAKMHIHRALREFASAGKAVLLSSTDYDELLQLADTITALRDSKPVGKLDRQTGMNEEALRELIGG